MWQEEIKLEKPLPLEDLVWHRLPYRFAYHDGEHAALECTESISQILRTPVVHILGQQLSCQVQAEACTWRLAFTVR